MFTDIRSLLIQLNEKMATQNEILKSIRMWQRTQDNHIQPVESHRTPKPWQTKRGP